MRKTLRFSHNVQQWLVMICFLPNKNIEKAEANVFGHWKPPFQKNVWEAIEDRDWIPTQRLFFVAGISAVHSAGWLTMLLVSWSESRIGENMGDLVTLAVLDFPTEDGPPGSQIVSPSGSEPCWTLGIGKSQRNHRVLPVGPLCPIVP